MTNSRKALQASVNSPITKFKQLVYVKCLLHKTVESCPSYHKKAIHVMTCIMHGGAQYVLEIGKTCEVTFLIPLGISSFRINTATCNWRTNGDL